MALVEFKFKPGIDKQQTEAGAENRWVDSDNVRFRYGLPEKVGGWSSLVTDTIVGVARKQHAFVDNDGNRYVALGTDKFLLIKNKSLLRRKLVILMTLMMDDSHNNDFLGWKHFAFAEDIP